LSPAYAAEKLCADVPVIVVLLNVATPAALRVALPISAESS
jgi:hypothetical protein